MTNHIFKLLEKEGIPTHYVEELSDRETAVKKVEIVPLEVIIRNITAGSFAKKMGVEEGIVFKRPTLEFSYKNDDLHDPFINKYYALSLELATEEEIDTITEYAFKVNEVMKNILTAWASTWWTLRSSSAATRARSSWLTRFPRIPAASGIRRPMRS